MLTQLQAQVGLKLQRVVLHARALWQYVAPCSPDQPYHGKVMAGCGCRACLALRVQA